MLDAARWKRTLIYRFHCGRRSPSLLHPTTLKIVKHLVRKLFGTQVMTG